MKCRVDLCSDVAVLRVFEVGAKSAQANPLLCGRHARSILDRYGHECAETNAPLESKSLVPFAVACLVMPETGDAAAVYLRGNDGSCFLLQGAKLEGWMLGALLSRRGRKHRPLTHEAAIRTINGLGGALQGVVIDGFRENDYRAKLQIWQAGNLILVDVRAIDGVALALAAGVPLLIQAEMIASSATRAAHTSVVDELLRAPPVLGTVEGNKH